MPLKTGVILNNRYRILKILGKGGFGAVYRAADMALKFPCAVKENLDTSPEAERQFEKEAVILASLSHPNLPRVRDHFIVPGQGQYLVMDFIEGDDLYSLVERTSIISEDQALNWINQIASALNYLHNQKPPIIHRDIKPANIRVNPDGKAFLVDFGLVKVYDPSMRTTIGARAVTPGYSPPEQYGHGTTDPRTDIYALSATLYTLLTGLEPQESIQRVVSDNLAPVDSIKVQIHPGLGRVIGRGMQLQPSQRYPTVAAFEQALKNPDSQEVAAKTQVAPPAIKTVAASYQAPEVRTPVNKKAWLWGIIGAGLIAAFFLIRAVFNNQPPVISEPTQVVAGNREVVVVPQESPEGEIVLPPTDTSRPSDTDQPTITLPPTEILVLPSFTSLPSTETPLQPDPMFTANADQYCRDDPGTGFEAHHSIYVGQTFPVLAQSGTGWYLLGIDDPSTRTKCCWVGGDGDLNVSLSSIQIINYHVDRISCDLY